MSNAMSHHVKSTSPVYVGSCNTGHDFVSVYFLFCLAVNYGLLYFNPFGVFTVVCVFVCLCIACVFICCSFTSLHHTSYLVSA